MNCIVEGKKTRKFACEKKFYKYGPCADNEKMEKMVKICDIGMKWTKTSEEKDTGDTGEYFR